MESEDSFFVYYGTVDNEDLTRLESLLQASKLTQEFTENMMLVAPRPSTISPWASKAIDIAKVCGIKNVFVERAVCYSSHKLNVCDPMLQCVLHRFPTEEMLLMNQTLESQEIDFQNPISALNNINKQMGLAITPIEMEYLVDFYKKINRAPTLTELMMFSQVNSEHCRHKIFNSRFKINNEEKQETLFEMIKKTHEKNNKNVISAYSDNAAIIKGLKTKVFNKNYKTFEEQSHIVLKAETHNHPTGVSPFSGAATGCGGEIRDEAAVGRGGRSKMGFAGYVVNDLNLDKVFNTKLWPWDLEFETNLASSVDIMLKAPLGSAAFGNEFGRPLLAGYFRTFSAKTTDLIFGYSKPIMIAGGLGTVRPNFVFKKEIPNDCPLVVLGGPCFLIGLGGGAASSLETGILSSELDFASVQRENPEMQRRCQMVIDSCVCLDDNPILSIHDVGAGGLSNALPELVHDSNRGARIELRSILCADSSLNPLQIWCNESQERYVMAIDPNLKNEFIEICLRERCPFSFVGIAIEEEKLEVYDSKHQNYPVNVPMSMLFPKMSLPERVDYTLVRNLESNLEVDKINIRDAVKRVLRLPCVGSKEFLITIADRFVGGLTVRDQMVGRWQVPVADVAVTSSSFESWTGEALALGERPLISLLSSAASARMAIGEALLNILAADVKLEEIHLSANWMAAANMKGEGANLYLAVEAAKNLCLSLGICIPVGKDSLSMKTTNVCSPVSLTVTAAALCHDTRLTLTPEMKPKNDTVLLLLDLGKNRISCSALSQVYSSLMIDAKVPDLDNDLKSLFSIVQSLRPKILAYHDRSDGGLLTTVAEMCFAGNCGLEMDVPTKNVVEFLFNEELGVVIQIKEKHLQEFYMLCDEFKFPKDQIHNLGRPIQDFKLCLTQGSNLFMELCLLELYEAWTSTSFHMSLLRDGELAKEAQKQSRALALFSKIPFKLSNFLPKGPKVAILREQGVNSYMEMAFCFDYAGFECVDVHMSDVLNGKIDLNDFCGFAACGGFSYGDVLGAGKGWANSILLHKRTRNMFISFFKNEKKFALGVCNGCQMLSLLRDLMPVDSGADKWPYFVRNKSKRFEARTVMVEVLDSPSIFFKNMAGTCLPCPVAHGEGRVQATGKACLRYLGNYYPANPNGSQEGLTGFTTNDGRTTIIMPHPERAARWISNSWIHDDWRSSDFAGPWLKMFQNAREWV